MIPGKYDFGMFWGDTFYGPLFTFPNLAGRGGPSDLTGATVRAELKEDPDSPRITEFEVEIVDPVARQVRMHLDAESAEVSIDKGVWSIEVEKDGWRGTILAGEVNILKEDDLD